MALVRGLTKVKDEAHIIGDTLDSWASVCNGGIHVYCDCSTDATAEICRAHPAVVEVIESDLYDPDRARSDMFNRQQLLRSAKRFPADWFCYFDADEQLVDFPNYLLDDPELKVLATHWHDVYITPEDVDSYYQDRDWVSDDGELIPHFFRNSRWLGFLRPDQRIMEHEPQKEYLQAGFTRHYGLGFSEEVWERKCEYYQQWPQYAEKWAKRRGGAVNVDRVSVKGTALKRFSEIRRSHVDSRLRAVG